MIFVDADACPVKDEIASIARRNKMDVLFIASYNHKPSRIKEDTKWVFVDPDSEASDLYILNHIKEGDVLVTQDIGLASLALQKGVYAFSPRGTEYTEDTIDAALNFRYLAAKERERGNYGKGPKPFTDNDRLQFLTVFEEICRKLMNDEPR